MYHCYILYSSKLDRYYVGSTADLQRRMQQHNSRKRHHYTSNANDWQLKYNEALPTRAQAQRRERQIKGMKSRAYIERLVDRQHEA